MKLTDRDLKLLLEIQNFGLLPTNSIHLRHFSGIALTTALRRLRVLEEARFIQRITGLSNGGHAWCMTSQGAERLNGEPTKTSFPQQILKHDLALTQLRMGLEEVGIAQAWIPEHVIRKRMAESGSFRSFRRANIPDGLMGVETLNGKTQAYAIELELTAKSQARYREIFRQYEKRNDLHAYWYVVQKPTIGNQITTARQQSSYRYGAQAPFLIWSVFEDVMSDPLNAKIYGQDEDLLLGEVLTTRAKSVLVPA